jgi:Ferritin-like domain
MMSRSSPVRPRRREGGNGISVTEKRPEMTVRKAREQHKAPLNAPSDLKREAVLDIARALNALLADMFALYRKTKNFHWHISGPHFRDYHLLLDEQQPPGKPDRRGRAPHLDSVRGDAFGRGSASAMKVRYRARTVANMDLFYREAGHAGEKIPGFDGTDSERPPPPLASRRLAATCVGDEEWCTFHRS